jgi:two-component system, OmpR family, response regulator
LIVDNNAQFADRARLLLEATGHYIACAVNDPRRALEAACSFRPDFVLLDLIMPEADGTEVAAEITSDWMLHSVPIVFVTSLITPEEARDARRINGHHISAKPHTAAELLRVVEESLPRCAEA